MAYQKNGLIYVFEGKINGTIVQPRGEGGFGFDPFFLSDNFTLTLAEAKPDEVNARAKAVECLYREDLFRLFLLFFIFHGAGFKPSPLGGIN